MSITMDLKCHLPPRQNTNQDRSLHKLAVRPCYQYYLYNKVLFNSSHMVQIKYGPRWTLNWSCAFAAPISFHQRYSCFSLLITKSEYFFLRSISLSTTLSRKFPNPRHKGPPFINGV